MSDPDLREAVGRWLFDNEYECRRSPDPKRWGRCVQEPYLARADELLALIEGRNREAT